MIHISQGHEKSIAIETLLKSIYMLPSSQLKYLKYFVNREVLKNNLDKLNIKAHTDKSNLYLGNDKKISCNFIKSSSEESSLKSIIKASEGLSENDILITPPTSKDKFNYNSTQYAGHTDFFRNFYNKNLSMNFINSKEQLLILTDHVPLKEVITKIDSKIVHRQIANTLINLKKYFNRTIETVLISGINPHAGEGGLIGNEESVIEEGINFLKKDFENITFRGPLPGDTQFNYLYSPKKTLQVYCHHDQALSYFKHKNGFIGLNTTFGLDFLRLSVDHGTAKELYGSNKSNPLGSYFVLINALKIHERIKL